MVGNDRRGLLFILDGFDGAGAGTERQFLNLLEGLMKRGWSPRILLLRHSAYLSHRFGDDVVESLKVHRLLSLRSWWLAAAAVLRYRRSGVKVAHIFFNDSSILFPMLLRLSSIRTIVSRRDLGFWYTRGNLIALRFLNRFADLYIANSTAVSAAVERHEAVPATKLKVIYNELIPSPRQTTAVSREQFGIPKEAFLIVSVANLRPLKRMGDAISALAALRRLGRNGHLLIVGEDRSGSGGVSHREELISAARALEVLDCVHFSGGVEDSSSFVRLADVCVLFSETEGLSNAVMEYMAAGKPVVCTAVGGNTDLIVDGDSGCLVPVGDIQGMAARLFRISEDGEFAERLGTRAAARAAALFAPGAMLAQHVGIYESLGAG